MVTFDFGRSNTNYHGTEKKGEPWNKQTVRGWKARIVGLETLTTKGVKTLRGKRLIIYKPDGSWLYFDVYHISLWQHYEWMRSL